MRERRPRINADKRGFKSGNLNRILKIELSGGRSIFLSAFVRVIPWSGLGYIDLAEAEAVEECGYGGAGVFAGGVEDAVGEGGLLELLLGLGAGVGLEILVDGDEKACGAGVDAGVLVVERRDEELRGGQSDVNGAAAVFLFDANVFGLELAEIDSGDGLAVDDEKKAVAREQVGEDGAGFGAFNDGVDGVDDGFEAVEPLDALDNSRNGGVVDSSAAGDTVCDVSEHASGGVADEDSKGGSAKDKREKKSNEGPGGATTRGVLGGHFA
jgi:hypothetical protein